MAYDAAAAKRRWYEAHKDECRQASRSWKRDYQRALRDKNTTRANWEQRRRAILSRRDPITHKYDNSKKD